jgi:hypothetical protein
MQMAARRAHAMQDKPPGKRLLEPAEREELLKQAHQSGLMGARDRQMGGRFPSALIEAAQKASGFSEPTELLTYALAKVAFEDNFGEALLTLEGTVPRGTFPED